MPQQDERIIRSIAVLGGGVVGLSAALAFAAALPGVEVAIVETPADPAALADRLPGGWPSIARFHAMIGLTEADVVRAGAANYRIGTRFEHWSSDDAPWFQVHGLTGVPVGSIPFHELWARARRAGGALPFHRYSAAAVLAEAGRFVHPEEDPRSPLSTYDYGLRVDVARYGALLSGLADRRGLARLRADQVGVERREDGGVAALLLDGDRRIEADLFLDCSGPAARLLSALGDDFEDWAAWLPCDRLLIGSAPAAAATSCDAVAATAAGWRWSVALPDGQLHGSAYAAAGPTAGEAGDGLEAIAIRPGRRRLPWRRNVLALGDAAVAVDPLGGASLHMAHSAIRRALDLLPGRDFAAVELVEYNRRSEQEALLLRDFQAMHYFRRPESGDPFWQALRWRPMPESLAHLLDQFGRRGRLPLLEEDPFGPETWIAALIGLGVTPQSTSPLADEVDPRESDELMRGLAMGLATLPGQLPPYADYMSRALRPF